MPSFVGTDGHDFYDGFEATEVVNVAGVQGQASCSSGGGDQQVDGTLAVRLASSPNNCSIDAAIRASCRRVERDGFQRRLNPLKALLPYGPLSRIPGGMDAGGQFGQCDCGDARLDG